MPSINLIASRREEKRRLEQRSRSLVYAIGGEVGVIIIVASIMMAKLFTIHGHIAELGQQIGQLQPKVDHIQQLQADTAILKPKVDILNKARNNTLYWYTAMQTVTKCLPQQTWLTQIGTAGDPAPPAPTVVASGSAPAPAASAPAGGTASLTIAGVAANSSQVGMAMMNMNQAGDISSVSVDGVTQTKIAKQNAMSFSMIVQLKPNTAQNVTTPVVDTQPAAVPTPTVTQTSAVAKPISGGSHV